MDKVIESHGDVNSWDGLLRYLAYTQKIVQVAKKGVAENLDYVQAYDKYFATDPAMAPFILEELKPGLEYGSTPKIRSLNNIYVAMMERRGEQVPLVMGAPPPPGASGPGAQPLRGAVPEPSEHANH